MKAHIFKHVSFEGPAAITDWLQKNKFEISSTCFYQKDALPSFADVDWLIIMGGPMSVNDEEQHSWLTDEKVFIRKCIESGKVVIGICLGAQLISSAMGSRIYPGQYKEIGWFPIVFEESGLQPIVFHWHGETFDLPDGAKLIASTEACRHQIFTLGRNVLAMQCHLEMTPESVKGMLQHCGSEIQEAPYIQSIQEILAGISKFTDEANNQLFKLLDNLKS